SAAPRAQGDGALGFVFPGGDGMSAQPRPLRGTGTDPRTRRAVALRGILSFAKGYSMLSRSMAPLFAGLGYTVTPLVVLPHRQGLCPCPLHVQGSAACAVAPTGASETRSPLLMPLLLARLSIPTLRGQPYTSSTERAVLLLGRACRHG